MKSEPCWTVVIAAFNAESHLPALVRSIRDQETPAGKLGPEIVLVDGRSSDRTVALARSLGCRVIDNPAGDVRNAKVIGLEAATSDKVSFVDQDERLMRKNSLLLKAQMLDHRPSTVAVICSGYVVHPSLSAVRNYVSEFGDPVSALLYSLPNADGRREPALKRRLNWQQAIDGAIVFDNKIPSSRVLIEFGVQGGMISQSRIRGLLDTPSQDATPLVTISELFGYAKLTDSYFDIGFIPDDPVEHLPSTEWSVVFSKVRWRISNSFDFSENSIRNSAVRGRLAAQFGAKVRGVEISIAVLFALYVLSLIPVLSHAVWISLTRRQAGMLMHVPLSFYVLLVSMSFWVLRFFKKKPSGRRYDGTPSQ